MDVKVQKNKSDRLVLPDGLGLDCLRREWSLDIHPQESSYLTFWDTFEWGVWFGGYTLYSCGQRYRLSVRQEGWSGLAVCEEQAQGRRRFWQDFEAHVYNLCTHFVRVRGDCFSAIRVFCWYEVNKFVTIIP